MQLQQRAATTGAFRAREAESKPGLAAADSEGIVVSEMRTRRDRADFIALPYRLHRADPNWTAPLRRDIRRLIDRRRNPFFEHGDACFWLARRGGVTVGRISAQINQLHLATHHDETGNFGMLEVIDDPTVFTALLRTAEGWLRERNMRRVVGPYSLSINDEIGLVVSGFETPSMVGLPHTPPYYARRLEGEGYLKVKDLHALRVNYAELVTQHLNSLERVTAKLQTDGRLGVRFLDPKRFAEDMRLALKIYNEAWTDNWGFLQVTEREAEQFVEQLAPVLPPQGVIFALADGEPAAILVALPNFNELLADLDGRLFPVGWLKLLWRMRFRKPKAARVILFGVGKRYRGSAISAALGVLMMTTIFKVGRDYGIDTVEFSWILEDNKASLEGSYAIGGRLAKVFRLYAKRL
jgi:hypothetical protein